MLRAPKYTLFCLNFVLAACQVIDAKSVVSGETFGQGEI